MNSKNFIEEDLYNKIRKLMPRPAVDVILFNKDFSKTLLFKRNNSPLKNNYYSLGGRLHLSESFLECASRKIKEEIGLIINKDLLIKVGVISELFLEKEQKEHFIVIYFSLILEEDSNLILDSQHSESKWFDVEDETIHPYLKKKIRECIKKKNEN
jgi:ADP-ribose pyrophosphatase YjhB (NUDIX family)